MYKLKNFIIFCSFLFVVFGLNLNSEESLKKRIYNFIFDETYKDDKNFKRHIFNLEMGAVVPLFNNTRTGLDTGRTIDFTKIQNEANFYFRISYYFNLDKKNGFRILIAPLKYSGYGNLYEDVNYKGIDFQQGNLTNYTYKFNSYRFTYYRNLFENEFFTFKLGITLKIRDASIYISQGNEYYKENNIGFVPLGYIHLEVRPIKEISFGIEGDLAGVRQGAAIDIGTYLRYNINDNISIGAIYRLLYGGVSIARNYNFAFFNYYGIQLNFAI